MPLLSESNVRQVSDELQRLLDSLRRDSVEAGVPPPPFQNVWSADDRLLSLSANVQQHIGWDPAFLMRSAPGRWLFRPGDEEILYPHFYRCFMGHPTSGVEYRMLHSDGTGYVWFSDDMIPGQRTADGRVREVRIRSYNVTAVRARELEFLIDCLRQFHPRHDSGDLAELGVPLLLANLFPRLARSGSGRVVRFQPQAGPASSSPGMEPVVSSLGVRRRRRAR